MRGRGVQLGVIVALAMVALSVGWLGLAIKTASPVVASSSTSPVTLQDGAGTNLAKVSSSGALSITGSVGTYPGIDAASALNLAIGGDNETGCSTNCTPELISPTQAKIDLTSLTVALDASNANPWLITLQVVTVPKGTTGGDCYSAGISGETIQAFELQPGTTATLSPASPIALTPASGKSVCLLAQGTNVTGSYTDNTGTFIVSATGYVASGTYSYPHNTDGNNAGGLGMRGVAPASRPFTLPSR
jgi:hypothetical protein